MTDENSSCSLYRHFDKDGKLLYVGVSLNVVNRLAQHKNASKWYSEIAKIDIEQFATREAALEAEKNAVIKENPIHNIIRFKPNTYTTKISASRADLDQQITRFDPVYTPQQVALLFQVPITKVTSWLAQKKLGYIVIGTKSTRYGQKDIVRVTGWDLLTFLEFERASKKEETA